MRNNLISEEATLSNNLQIPLHYNVNLLILWFDHEVNDSFNLDDFGRIELPWQFKRFITVYEFHLGVVMVIRTLKFYLHIVDEKFVGFQ